MSQQQSKIPHSSVIMWKTGIPIKYGNYLILCEQNGSLVIHDDVWFGGVRGWQSQWHGMIAWCAYEDIAHKLCEKQIPQPPRPRYLPQPK